jgi:hypothetical protein
MRTVGWRFKEMHTIDTHHDHDRRRKTCIITATRDPQSDLMNVLIELR